MSVIQKVLLVVSCVFYLITVLGGLRFGAFVATVFFLLHSLTIILFAYMVFKDGRDSSMLMDTYKQDIGQELAGKDREIEVLKGRIDEKETEIIDINRKNDELKIENDDLKKKGAKLEADIEALDQKTKEIEKEKEIMASKKTISEGLLPPVEEGAESSTVNIIELAKTAVAELSESARAVSLIITVQSSEDTLLVKADPNRLITLFRNIIDNSIKYMNKAGSLVITISTINDDIFIVLKDTGEGLNEDETRHIFELNFQGSNRLSGNGLGLTQAKAIVEYYGGTIYAKSMEGKGMGIYIQLPA